MQSSRIIELATMGLIGAGIGVVVGVCVWRDPALRAFLLLHIANFKQKIESFIKLIRKQPTDSWYIKLFKFILGVMIIKIRSQFILLPLVNWCWDIVITNIGPKITISIQLIIGSLSKIDFTILSQIDFSNLSLIDFSILISLIWGLKEIIKVLFDNNLLKLSSNGEPGNSPQSSQVVTNNTPSPTQEVSSLNQTDSNSASSLPSNISEDYLDRQSERKIMAIVRRLNDERDGLIIRAEEYKHRKYSEYSEDPEYLLTIRDMAKHHTNSRIMLNFLIDKGGGPNVLNSQYNRHSLDRFIGVFSVLIDRHPFDK